MKKVAINGFGRIGRLIFCQLITKSNIEIVAINDLTNAETLAHLLKYDTSMGKFNGNIHTENGMLVVNNKKIIILAERDPKALPWKKLNIDIVVESTGLFTSSEKSEQHIIAGAKKVLISAPATGNLKTIVYSVNEKELNNNDKIVSAASCTTNCLAPIVNVLEKEFGIIKGLMTTVHAYTADQKLQDAPHKDLRRARAGAQNIVPTTTGAAAAVGLVLPQLKGKLNGIAMRVPVITGSVVDLIVELKDKNVTSKLINEAIKKNTSDTLAYIDEPIVSSDVIKTTYGSLFDSLLTLEIEQNGTKMFKVVSWYDNENSYASQYVRTLLYMINL